MFDLHMAKQVLHMYKNPWLPAEVAKAGRGLAAMFHSSEDKWTVASAALLVLCMAPHFS
jgi:hypothetical protein